jgi:hypothetical protein
MAYTDRINDLGVMLEQVHVWAETEYDCLSSAVPGMFPALKYIEMVTKHS